MKLVSAFIYNNVIMISRVIIDKNIRYYLFKFIKLFIVICKVKKKKFPFAMKMKVISD